MIPLRLHCRVGRLGLYIGAFAEERGLPPREPMPNLGRPPVPKVTFTAAAFARWRQARGLSQAELAATVGCYEGRITEFESGSKKMSIRTAEVIAAGVGLTLAQLEEEVSRT